MKKSKSLLGGILKGFQKIITKFIAIYLEKEDKKSNYTLNQ